MLATLGWILFAISWPLSGMVITWFVNARDIPDITWEVMFEELILGFIFGWLTLLFVILSGHILPKSFAKKRVFKQKED